MPRQSTRGTGRGDAGCGRGQRRRAGTAGTDEPPSAVRSSPSRSKRRWSARSSSTPCRSSSSRALPDVRDGLKPVHRRILYSMFDHGPAPRPAAQQVRQGRRRGHGDLPPPRRLGHLRGAGPHGPGLLAAPPADRRPRQLRRPRPRRRRRRPCATPSAGWRRSPSSCMAGHRRGDRRHGRQLRRLRPKSRSSCRRRFPNLLVNGSQGIAVGMATNIPPHNLGEVIDAAIHVLDHPEATPDDLMAVRQGPGLPDRRADPRAPGHPRRLPDRARLDQDARRRRDRRGPRAATASW